MNEDRLNRLLEKCESPIEEKLLENLYPRLKADPAQELSAQYEIDCYLDMDLTIPDFAFPYLQIAIYCDGFKMREGNRDQFEKDRFQSRELQLRGWLVLRFAGREINRDIVMVVKTIERAIDQQERERTSLNQQQQTEEESWQESVRREHQRDKKRRRDTAMADFYFSRGRNEVEKDKYDDGIVNLTKAIELNPLYANSYHYRGVAHYFKADYTLAITDYSRAIDLNPEASASYNGRGAAYAKRGDRTRAEEDYMMAKLLIEENIR